MNIRFFKTIKAYLVEFVNIFLFQLLILPQETAKTLHCSYDVFQVDKWPRCSENLFVQQPQSEAQFLFDMWC